MSPSEWFLLVFGILFLWFWVEFDPGFDEEPERKSGYVEVDTNEEDLLEIFNNE